LRARMRCSFGVLVVVVVVAAGGCGSRARHAGDAASDRDSGCVLSQASVDDLERKVAEAKRAEEIAEAKAEFEKKRQREVAEPCCDGRKRVGGLRGRSDAGAPRRMDGLTDAGAD
jgi:hypothetical protein